MFKSAQVRYIFYRNGIRSACDYVTDCITQRELENTLIYIRNHCLFDSSCHADIDVTFYSLDYPYKVVIMGAI